MKIQFFVFFIFIFVFIGCKKEETASIVKFETKNMSYRDAEINKKVYAINSEITNDKIMGIWTTGESRNATFEIKSNSIYYVDNFKDYRYELNNDTIEIKYSDYTYRAKIFLKNDTLIMKSKEYSLAKYWRFKE